MAYSKALETRISNYLKSKNQAFESKQMMGGLCYMVNDKMCVGIIGDNLMARVGPEAKMDALDQPGCREMDFTGRPMKAFVVVEASAIWRDAELEAWVERCLAFNPKAKASKKRKRPGVKPNL